MSQRERLLDVVSWTLASVSVAACATAAQAAPKKAANSVECFGVNTCKGTNGCSVGKAQIAAANEAYGNKFEKSVVFDCSGTSECSAKSGHLAWVAKPTEADCFKAEGFVFDNKNGQFTVRKKAKA